MVPGKMGERIQSSGGPESRQATGLAGVRGQEFLSLAFCFLFKRSSAKRMKGIEGNSDIFGRYQNWTRQDRSTLKAQLKLRS